MSEAALPILEQIAANVKTTIEGITAANGYQQDLRSVTRPVRNTIPDTRDLSVEITQGDAEPDIECPHMFVQWIQTFAITAFVVNSDTATAPIDTRINTLRADIEKCLRVDPSRGGLAIDTTIGPPLIYEEPGAFTGIVIIALVRYRTLEDDPYSQ